MEEARALVQFAICPNRGLGTPAGGDGSLHSGLCPMEESHIWKKPIVFILPTQLRGELTPVLFLSGSGSVKIGAAYTGFPGGPVVKNPPANARDVSSITGPGRSHTSRKILHGPGITGPGRSHTSRKIPHGPGITGPGRSHMDQESLAQEDPTYHRTTKSLHHN